MKIKIASAQYPLTAFANFDAWRRHTADWVADAGRQGAQLMLFPEYGSMELASLLEGSGESHPRGQAFGLSRFLDDFQNVYAELARRWSAVIVAPSFPVADDGKIIVNRAFVFSHAGLTGWQDKYFMTRFEAEDWGVSSAGPEFTLFEADWGAFGVQICYDVEFFVGAAALCAQGAGLILAPSCTETIRGATRVHVGARARALENQCFVAVSQTVGEAPWSSAVDVNYGFAAIYSTPDDGLPEAGILAQKTPQETGWLVQDLDFQKIEQVRADGQVFNFKDQRRIGTRRLEGKNIRVTRKRV